MLTVKEWRKAKGYSIANMADLLDVSPVTWTHWEKEPYKIPVGRAIAFCDLLGIDFAQIIFLPKNSTKCSVVTEKGD